MNKRWAVGALILTLSLGMVAHAAPGPKTWGDWPPGVGQEAADLYGGLGGGEAYAQRILVTKPMRVASVSVLMTLEGQPTDKVIVRISEVLGGPAIATSVETDPTVLPQHSDDWHGKYLEFVFPDLVLLKKNTEYFIEVHRTGPRDEVNLLHVHNTCDNPYLGGEFWRRGEFPQPNRGASVIDPLGHQWVTYGNLIYNESDDMVLFLTYY